MRNIITVLILITTITISNPVSAQRKRNKPTKNQPVTTATQPVEEPYTGPPVVKLVVSGDLLQLKSGELVRLMGADAPVMPEISKPGQEPWASSARQFMEELVLVF